MNTTPLTADQYRKLAAATRTFAQRCIDPDLGLQYIEMAKSYDAIAARLEPLCWAFRDDVQVPLIAA